MNILVTSLAEDADTSSPTKVADIVVTDSDGGTNNLTLRGPDSSDFEIDAMELFLRAGVALDFETNPALDVMVEVDDLSIGGSPDDTDSHTISITDVNEPPTIALANTVTSLAEDADTSSPTKVADIVVTDSDGGTHNTSLSVGDSEFEIDGTELFLKAGAVLVASSTLNVTVDVDDPLIGATPDDLDSLAINITAAGATVVNLEGSNSSEGRTWTAILGVEVLNGGGSVVGVDVVGSSTEDLCEAGCTCTTNVSGQCSLSAIGIRKNIGSTVFTILTVDGVGDGSSIAIFKP
jgi:hypothetical protein